MIVQHSSRTDNWATPTDILNLCRDVLGEIDLDPASSEHHNKNVGARRFISSEEDGLITDWFYSSPGTVFLNPPGGKKGNQSITKMFWSRLIEYRQRGLINHAIFLAFSAESMQNTQSLHVSIPDFPICIPAKRIRFVSVCGEKNQPSHSNCICYVPGLINQTPQFYQVFKELGKVVIPYTP